MTTTTTRLTDHERRTIAQVRALRAASMDGELREYLTANALLKPGDDMYPMAFGAALYLLDEVAAIAERLGGDGA